MTSPKEVIQSLLNLADAEIEQMNDEQRHAWAKTCAEILLSEDVPEATKQKVGRVYGKITEPMD